jgi:hypothetical protein
MKRITTVTLAAALAFGVTTATFAQTAAAPPEKPKTLWEEHVLVAYIENSWVWNLGHTGRHDAIPLTHVGALVTYAITDGGHAR